MDTTQTLPFRFGVVAMQPPPGQAWPAFAQEVEGLGYDSLVMPDNVAHGLAVFPALAAAATATTRLRLGTYVLANDLRHPVEVAKETFAVALLSDGRFELGLGAGRPASDRDNAMLGLPFDNPGTRVSRLAESIGLIKRLLAGETVTEAGEHYTVTEASVVPYGVEPPRVPLLVAAGAPRMLRLAGAEADTVALALQPDADEAAFAARVAQVRAAADGRPVEINVNLMAVGDVVPRHLAGQLDPAALSAAGAVPVVTGSPEEMAEQLRVRRERLGISYVLVGQELMHAFAPVLPQLAGE